MPKSRIIKQKYIYASVILTIGCFMFLSFQNYTTSSVSTGIFIKELEQNRCLEFNGSSYTARACSGIIANQNFKLESMTIAPTVSNGRRTSTTVLRHVQTQKCLIWVQQQPAPATHGSRSTGTVTNYLSAVACNQANNQAVTLGGGKLVFTYINDQVPPNSRGERTTQPLPKSAFIVIRGAGVEIHETYYASRADTRPPILPPNSFQSRPFYAKANISKPTVGVIGDSISTSLLAKYTRNDRPGGGSFFDFVPVLGDAISLYRAYQSAQNSPEEDKITFKTHSWATGNVVYSFASRLQELYGTSITQFNQARNGATITSNGDRPVANQLRNLRQLSAQVGKIYPDLVLVLIGANDAIGKTQSETTPASTFQSHYRGAIEDILQSSPNTRIVVGLVPDLSVFERLSNFNVGESHGIGECKDVWKKTPQLNMVTQKENAQALMRNVNDYNNIIRSSVSAFRKKYGDRIRLVTATFDEKIGADGVSVDCFHPNYKTQHRIADAFWRESWWGENPAPTTY